MPTINRFFYFIAVSLFILILDYFGFLNFLKSPLDQIITPVKKEIFLASSSVKDVFTVIGNYSQILNFYHEKESLVKKTEELEVKVRYLESENQKMRTQLEAPFPATYKFVPAHIIAQNRYLEIDQGENEGIKKGQYAVDGQTLIGIVSQVTPERSDILPVTDTDFSIPAVTSRGTQGEVTGQGEGNIVLTRVLQKDPLFLGDQVVTTGAEFIPANLLIGKISHIAGEESASYKQAKVDPLVDYYAEKIVFIITSL